MAHTCGNNRLASGIPNTRRHARGHTPAPPRGNIDNTRANRDKCAWQHAHLNIRAASCNQVRDNNRGDMHELSTRDNTRAATGNTRGSTYKPKHARQYTRFSKQYDTAYRKRIEAPSWRGNTTRKYTRYSAATYEKRHMHDSKQHARQQARKQPARAAPSPNTRGNRQHARQHTLFRARRYTRGNVHPSSRKAAVQRHNTAYRRCITAQIGRGNITRKYKRYSAATCKQ